MEQRCGWATALWMMVWVVVPNAHASSPQISISHRGASAYAPEHTFFAYDLAMQQDTDMLECDAQLTRDEVIVCIHDTTVDRTSDARGAVESFTLAQLREQDFGSWFNAANPQYADPEYAGARVVAFEEQLDCYLRHNPRMRFHVETKDSAGGRAEQVIADMLTRKGLVATGDLRSSTVLIQSFDAGSLERIKQLAPTLPTAYLFALPTTAPAVQWALTGVVPDYIDAMAPNSAFLTANPLAVSLYQANGLDVHTWTVNDPAQMKTLLDMGVDGLFTNNPDLLRTAIEARGTGVPAANRGNPKDFKRGCPGVAGRVTSNQGPGDVWQPLLEGRGVRLAQAYEVPAKIAPGLSRYGGAWSLFAGLLLVIAAAVRRL